MAQTPISNSDMQSNQSKLDQPDLEKSVESTPLIASSGKLDTATGKDFARNLNVLIWGAAVIAASSALINFNKYLMQPGRFPFAVPLVMMHSFFATIFAGFLRIICPSLFPSLSDEEKKVELCANYLTRCILPVAGLGAFSLVLSNTAYKFASVAFLQMMKQGNVIIVYVFSLCFGLEVFSTKSVLVLGGVVLATVSTINGELNFSMVGFIIQGCCCFVESLKVVLQGILLAGTGKKLDPLSFVLIVSPMIFLFLSVFVVAELSSPHAIGFELPAWKDFIQCKWLLAANVLLAFALNVICALFLKYGSPIAFLLVNIVKDIMIVVVSSMFLGEVVSQQQMISFPVQLVLIFLWSLMKSHPDLLDRFNIFSMCTGTQTKEKV
jgi:hypothetical protein